MEDSILVLDIVHGGVSLETTYKNRLEMVLDTLTDRWIDKDGASVDESLETLQDIQRLLDLTIARMIDVREHAPELEISAVRTALRNLLSAVEPYDNDRLEDAEIYRAAQQAREALTRPEPENRAPVVLGEPGEHIYAGETVKSVKAKKKAERKRSLAARLRRSREDP